MDHLSISARLMVVVESLADRTLQIENSPVMVAVVWFGVVPIRDYGNAATLVGSVLLVTAVG